MAGERRNTCGADRLVAMWVLLVTSGMRPSEVLGLPWVAVDLEAGVLSIYQKLIKIENRAVIADGTKVDHTGAAVAQVIVLAPVAAAMLRAWRAAQVKERRLWPWRKDHNDLVFTREDGAPLKPDWLHRRFKQLARQAGLPEGVRVYDLRHGWTTAALRAGVHPKLIQEVMRHSSYSTTADTYPRDARAQRRGGPDRGRAVRGAMAPDDRVLAVRERRRRPDSLPNPKVGTAGAALTRGIGTTPGTPQSLWSMSWPKLRATAWSSIRGMARVQRQ